jgi:predicted amidohydrolase
MLRGWVFRAVLAAAVFGAAGFSFAETAAVTPQPEDGWTTYSQRPEIAPKSWVDRRQGKHYLVLAGGGNAAVDGCWRKVVPVVGGQTYRFSASCLMRRLRLERRSILARVVWLDAKGQPVDQPDYPPTVTPFHTSQFRSAPGKIEGWCIAPQKATQARLELVFRWDPSGEVYWDEIRFEPGALPKRVVRLATICCRPKGTKSARESVEKFAELVGRAAAQKPDFICLPEGITVIGTGKKYIEVAEPIPGPTTGRLGELARQSRAYIVAGLYEREGKTVYNTAVLMGRDGRLVGRYRKASLPNEEIAGGITPGDSFPVFETDFGKVGMMICWDVFFPEPARALAARGAEIIFLPIWGGEQHLIEARPIENQVYLVTSSYDAKTAVYDRTGKIIAEANEKQPIAVTEIDLSQPTRWPWLGDYRGRIPREAPPVMVDLP